MGGSQRIGAVLHLLSSLQVGGAERFVLDLGRLQLRQGLAVGIAILGTETDPLVPEARALGFKVLCLKSCSRPTRAWRLFFAVRRAAPPGRLPVVHVHSPWALQELAPVVSLLGARVLYTRHGSGEYDGLRWRALHTLMRPYLHCITFVSREAERVFTRVHGCFLSPHVVVDNGVNLEVPLERAAAAGGRLRVGSVGRLVELKGQRLLLESLAMLPAALRQRFSAHFFGEGPQRQALADYAGQHLPDVPVIFHGAVLDREQIYREIDVLAVSSSTEGLSLAIMEALARQIPVVATSVGGNPRLVRPEETGLLVPYGDTAALAAALRRLGADPGLRQRLGRGGREHMARSFSLEATARRYLDLYQMDRETARRMNTPGIDLTGRALPAAAYR